MGRDTLHYLPIAILSWHGLVTDLAGLVDPRLSGPEAAQLVFSSLERRKPPSVEPGPTLVPCWTLQLQCEAPPLIDRLLEGLLEEMLRPTLATLLRNLALGKDESAGIESSTLLFDSSPAFSAHLVSTLPPFLLAEEVCPANPSFDSFMDASLAGFDTKDYLESYSRTFLRSIRFVISEFLANSRWFRVNFSVDSYFEQLKSLASV
jgi:hypothetical protein